MPYRVINIVSPIEKRIQDLMVGGNLSDSRVVDMRFITRSKTIGEVTKDVLAFVAKCRMEEEIRDNHADDPFTDEPFAFDSDEKMINVLLDRLVSQHVTIEITHTFCESDEVLLDSAIELEQELQATLNASSTILSGLDAKKRSILTTTLNDLTTAINRTLTYTHNHVESIDLLSSAVIVADAVSAGRFCDI